MKENKHMKYDFRDIKSPFDIDRRDFLKRLGGGVVILFSVTEFSVFSAEPAFQRQMPTDFNAYLRVGSDGRISLFTGKIEMGQGVVTSLAQMLADEMDVSLETIDMVMGDTDLCPWDAGTYGSQTTRFFGPPLRAAGAEARAVLIELAAESLGVPAGNLQVKNGIVSEKNNAFNRISYAQLADGKEILRTLDPKPPAKGPEDFKVIGNPTLRQDALEKVTGKAKYAGDYRLPGMLYARILRPPSHGAKLSGADTSEAEKIRGIQVVRERDLIAVLHESPEIADEATTRIKAEYTFDEMAVDDTSIFTHLLSKASGGRVVNKKGDLATGQKLSGKLFEREYLNSYVAHAPIEPHTALAFFDGDRMTIWASTQTPFRVKESVAAQFDLPQEKVRVITPFVGGGFGGKTSNRQANEAALLTKKTGKPVMVAWNRREEFFYDTFRPAAIVKVRSGITASGMISLWDYAQYYAGERGSDTIYEVPHQQTLAYGSGWTAAEGTHPFGTGAWRAPGNNTNTFARESQIDIMASAAKTDPLEFRLKNLTDEKMAGVLKAVAEKFGWSPAVSPSGRGFGIACGTDAGTYVAHMAEVQVDKRTGKVTVVRVACAQNMGLVINPAGAKIQMEGCITMGLGYALTEEIHFTGGKIAQQNFDTYDIPRFSWTPEIETVFLEDVHSPPQGGGEPAIICMGALLANAIFDATGARLFQLPMTPERILTALGTAGRQ